MEAEQKEAEEAAKKKTMKNKSTFLGETFSGKILVLLKNTVCI